jgi:hypothetical protein
MPQSPRLIVNGYAETAYNIVEFEGCLYALHRDDGSFDIERIEAGDTRHPVYIGDKLDDVAAQIDGRIDEPMLRNIVTGFGWRGRRGLVGEIGPHPNDFLLYAFFGSADDVATALCVALRNERGPFNLIGERDKTAALWEALSKEGHRAAVIEWRYGDGLPSLPESKRAILCEVPQTPDDYAALFALRERYPACSTIWN